MTIILNSQYLPSGCFMVSMSTATQRRCYTRWWRAISWFSMSGEPQAEPQPQKGGDLESAEFLLSAALQDVAREAGGDEQQLVWVESLEEGRRLHVDGGLRNWRHQRAVLCYG